MSRAGEIRDVVIGLVQPLLAVEGLILVECVVALSRGSLRLELVVDREDSPADGVHGLTLGEYPRLTRYLSDVLEAEMPEQAEFRLTVGSPGINRSLESELELRWGVGKEIEVRFKRGRDKLVGRLRAFDDECVTVETKAAGLQRIKREEIAGLRLYFPFPKHRTTKRR